MTASMTADCRMQESVFAFLMDSAKHPRVHRIDTHAASVFLEGDRAMKIKRAVRLPYLDYSTLEKRKAACDEEIRINRQFAPQIYHRVVPITQDADGSLAVDGDGTPVEFAIEMTRFDERQTVDVLAEAGPPDPDLVAVIADAVAASHWSRHARQLSAGSRRSLRLSKAIPRRFGLRPAFPSATSTTSGRRPYRHLRGFVGCWNNAAHRDMCDAAMATCTWPTSC